MLFQLTLMISGRCIVSIKSKHVMYR